MFLFNKSNFLALGLLLVLTACGGGGGSGTSTSTSTETTVEPVDLDFVLALFPTNGANWNDYLSGADIASASDAACSAGVDPACIHGGELRVVEAIGKTSCAGLTASDDLGAFNWVCDDSTGSARMISSRLADGMNLSDLVDFTTPGFKSNRVTVFENGSAWASSPGSAWWSNTVESTTPDAPASLNSASTIYLQNADATGVFVIDSDKVSLVIKPGVTLSGPGISSTAVISADNRSHLWVEGSIDATADLSGIVLTGVHHSMLRNVSTANANSYGIHFDGANNNTLSGITANDNTYGIFVKGLPLPTNNNTLTDITASRNDQGVYLLNARYHTLTNIMANNNDTQGVNLEISSNNTLAEITANDNTTGVSIGSRSNNNTLSNVTASNGTFGISLRSVSNNTLSDITASNNSTGVYVREASSNMLSGVTASNNSNTGVYLELASSNVLSGVTASDNLNIGVNFLGSLSNTLSGITASNNDTGISIESNSNNNTLSEIAASNNNVNGVSLISASGNSLSTVSANNNNQRGISLLLASGNSLSTVTASNNIFTGVFLNSASNNTLSGVTASNNGTGVHLLGAPNSRLSGVTASNNGGSGVLLSSASNNTLSGLTANNNGGGGVDLQNATSSNNTLSGVTASNNRTGIRLQSAANNRLSSLISSNSTTFGFTLSDASNNMFTGLLKVGNNTTQDCYVNNGTNPGLVNFTCANDAGAGSDATLTTGITLANSFVGKVTTDDERNTSDNSGSADFSDVDATFDWLQFDNPYRGWGIDGSVFPNSDQLGRWIVGIGRIWDWSLHVDDTVALEVLALPTGNDTLTHSWDIAAATPVNDFDCNAIVTGSIHNGGACETTYLHNAAEIPGDNIGNDNGLCENDETCLYAPNIGSYQGHGNLISAGAFTAGTLSGITLMRFETNGSGET